MNILKLSIKSIKNKKIISSLIIIQFIAIMLVITIGYDEIRKFKLLEDNFKITNLNKENTYFLKCQTKEYSEDIQNFYKDLKEKFGDENIGVLNITNTDIKEISYTEQFQNLRKTLTKGTFKERYPQAIEIAKIDYATYNMINPIIVEGQALKSEDFNLKFNDTVPIIVSEVYKGIINIGDILEIRGENKSKVIGFYNKNLLWLREASVYDIVLNYGDKFIKPFIINNTEEGIKEELNDMFMKNCIVKDYIYKNKEKTQNIIESLATKNKINIELYNAEDEINMIKETAKDIFNKNIISTVILLIFTCISVASIIYYSINYRKREICINFSCGASKSYIKALIINEIFICLLVSLIITIILISFRNHNKFQEYFNAFGGEEYLGMGFKEQCIPLFQIIIEWLIIATTSLISALIPISKINNLEVNNIIRGD